MFKLFRFNKCEHEYEKTTETIIKKIGIDELVITRTTYTCTHCKDTFKVIEDSKVILSRFNAYLKEFRRQLDDGGNKKRRTINRMDLKVVKNPLKTGCTIKNK